VVTGMSAVDDLMNEDDPATEQRFRGEAASGDLPKSGNDPSELKLVQAELTKLRDVHYRMLARQSEQERRSAAAVARQVHRRINAISDYDVSTAVSTALAPLTELIYRITQLGDRVGPGQVAELKRAADDAHAALSLRRATQEGPALIRRLQDEVTRMRHLVMALGQELHAEHIVAGGDPGLSPGDMGCACRGCRMIVDMDATDKSVAVALTELPAHIKE
jgi:hypothetical protein